MSAVRVLIYKIKMVLRPWTSDQQHKDVTHTHTHSPPHHQAVCVWRQIESVKKRIDLRSFLANLFLEACLSGQARAMSNCHPIRAGVCLGGAGQWDRPGGKTLTSMAFLAGLKRIEIFEMTFQVSNDLPEVDKDFLELSWGRGELHWENHSSYGYG